MTEFWITEFMHEGLVIGVLTVIGVILWNIRKSKDNWLDRWFK